MKNYTLTVFTPTYNRAYIIRNVFESLKLQSFTDFEWLIIDDGSTDNTEELIESFKKEKHDFDIRYIKKENGGQHTALNAAISAANSELFMIVDSDDYLSENAMERIMVWIKSISRKKELYAGVAGLRGFISGGVIGSSWKAKNQYIDVNPLERKKNGLDGDKAEVFFLSVLKKYYPIPVFEGENDVEKGVLWNRTANAGYLIRYFNEVIYYGEYLEDGMTKNIYQNWLKNFKGYTLWMKEFIHSNITIIQRFKNVCMYVLLAEKKGLSAWQCKQKIEVHYIEIIIAKIFVEIYHKRVAKNKYHL